MLYQSTRQSDKKIAASQAIVQGLAEDGGLYVPESFPTLTRDDIENLSKNMTYDRRAAYIMGLFLSEYDKQELGSFTGEAYNEPNFDDSSIAPLHKINDNTFFLELWHGPTSAFKDMALQVLPRLLTAGLRKINENRDICILVATSGDTGKAALEGFCDIPGTKIMVFYPNDGVSEVQKLQMVSQRGANVNVVAVEGNFDDAQNGVKAIFSDADFNKKLAEKGVLLSSANSINWGRLVPQIVYYISSYCDLISSGEITNGDKVNFCVPTGNFGNILSAYYASKMGLPINKLICASNRNDVLTQFLNTGVYDKNRPFYTTASPSMDILVSSNLERLLYELSGRDGNAVSEYMRALADKGVYEVPENIMKEAESLFYGGFCNEEDTMKNIAETFEKYDYLIDTHTAVGNKVLVDYRTETSDKTPTVVVSTASPYKFCDSVLSALGKPVNCDGVELIDELSSATNTAIPAPLAELRNSKSRFSEVVSKADMKTSVMKFLGV